MRNDKQHDYKHPVIYVRATLYQMAEDALFYSGHTYHTMAITVGQTPHR